MIETRVLIPGEPVPSWCYPAMNVLVPAIRNRLFEHALLYGVEGVESRAFDGLVPYVVGVSPDAPPKLFSRNGMREIEFDAVSVTVPGEDCAVAHAQRI